MALPSSPTPPPPPPAAVDTSPPICTVCFEEVSDGRSSAKLICSHMFHLDCIGSTFNALGKMRCPNCRRVEDGEWRRPHEGMGGWDRFFEREHFDGDIIGFPSGVEDDEHLFNPTDDHIPFTTPNHTLDLNSLPEVERNYMRSLPEDDGSFMSLLASSGGSNSYAQLYGDLLTPASPTMSLARLAIESPQFF